jgi:hypothetical protein
LSDAPEQSTRGEWQPTTGWQVRRVWTTVSGPATLVLFGLLWFHKLPFLPVWLVFAALALVTAVGTMTARRRREGTMQQLARAQGWSYAENELSLAERWSTSPFGEGRDRRAYDVVVGTIDGHSCAAFGYRYTTGSGDHTTTTSLSICCVALPGPLPEVVVEPESIVGEHAPGLLREDIDIESEDFNRRFRVHAADRKYASDVLTPRAVDALLSVEPFAWRIIAGDLLAWSSPTDGATLLARLRVLSTVAQSIPAFVWRNVGQEPPRPPLGPS